MCRTSANNHQLMLLVPILIFSAIESDVAKERSNIPPAYVSDVELAKSPVIVVAKWEGAAFVNESKVEGNVLQEHQTRCKITVERVIKGELEPGEHTILVGYAIGWSHENPVVTSYMSSMRIGDALATESNLWFLDRKQSIHDDDDNEYLYLSTYRGVQPRGLEPYFDALRSENPAVSVPKLLTSDNSRVVVRSLIYLCGDDYAIISGLIRGNHERVRKSILGHDETIKELIASHKKDVRRMAVWAYADLLGEQSIEVMQELLGHFDPDVRAIAIATLIHHGDWDSSEQIQNAIEDIQGLYGSRLVDFCDSITDDRVVPIMITMLQTTSPDNNSWMIPGVDAQEALKRRTGVTFPFDVETSLAAWKEIQSLGDSEEKDAAIRDLIEDFKTPLQATLVGDADEPLIRITNVGSQKIMISERPDSVTISTPRSSSGSAGRNSSGNTTYLEPGEFIEESIELDKRFFIHEAKDRRIEVRYLTYGRPLGTETWAGTLDVEPGDDWSEPDRVVEKVEIRWPNGNLKETGQKINGFDVGEWHYFNEEGDRTKIRYSAGSWGTCNPEHPNNKGAGKRK